MQTIFLKILGVFWLAMLLHYAINILLIAPEIFMRIVALCLIAALGVGILAISFYKAMGD